VQPALEVDIMLQEAKLPRRNSASATHVCLGPLGWLTDRVIHWTPQTLYK